ncbi:hypothetical protein V8F06_010053 [Rhypophila decipiens]
MLVSSEATGRVPGETQRGRQCNAANKRAGERHFGKGPFWETTSSAHKLTFSWRKTLSCSTGRCQVNINIGTIIMDKAHFAMLAPVISGRESDEWFIRDSRRTPLFFKNGTDSYYEVFGLPLSGQASQWGTTLHQGEAARHHHFASIPGPVSIYDATLARIWLLHSIAEWDSAQKRNEAKQDKDRRRRKRRTREQAASCRVSIVNIIPPRISISQRDETDLRCRTRSAALNKRLMSAANFHSAVGTLTGAFDQAQRIVSGPFVAAAQIFGETKYH